MTAREQALARVNDVFDSVDRSYDDPAPETYLVELDIALSEDARQRLRERRHHR